MEPASPNLSHPHDLQHALELIRSNKLADARLILAAYLQGNSNSDYAWTLMSYTVNDPEHQIDCLEHALKINPENFQAQARLAQIRSRRDAPSGTPVPDGAGSITPFLMDEPLPEDAPPPPAADAATDQALPTFRPQDYPGATRRMVYTPASSPAVPTYTRQSSGGRGWVIAGLAFLLLLVILGGYLLFRQYREQQSALATQQALTYLALHPPVHTPQPDWTFTPTPTFLPTNTPRPTATMVPTATFFALNATAFPEYETIEAQVSSLRSLPIQATPAPYIINMGQAKDLLLSRTGEANLEHFDGWRQALVAMGLVDPAYDFTGFVVNHIADRLGGFYLADSKEIYIIGIKFGPLETYIFSHEFDHALVDQAFDLQSITTGQHCEQNREACQALEAVLEGDSALLTDQWAQRYAAPVLQTELLTYLPPALAIPEGSPPPFLTEDASFNSVYGYAFVKYLYQRGGWSQVNRAYQKPPANTQQIIHPNIYLSGKKALDVTAPDLSGVLGQDWVLRDNNVFGEWYTYLLLRYNAGGLNSIDQTAAAAAAAGWSGDRYQVYIREGSASPLLAAEWIWDSAGDAAQFQQALTANLDERYPGGAMTPDKGKCWMSSTQVACLYQAQRRSLWLVAPDFTLLGQVLTRYPDF